MQDANFFTPGYGDQVEQQNIERQRKMAEMLRGQATTPEEGKMVSGHFVAPSWTQQLAKVLQGYSSGVMQQGADEKQTAMAKALGDRNQADTSSFMQAMQGSPARTQAPATPVDDNGVPNIPAQFDAIAPDRNKALEIASRSSSPMLQGYSKAMIEQLMKTPENPFSKVDAKDFTPESLKAFSASGGKDYTLLDPVRKMENINGVAVNPFGLKAGTVLPQDPNALFNRGPDGQAALNQQVFDAKRALAKSGASNMNTTVSMAGPENEYNKTVGKGLADTGLALVDAAKGAPEIVRNAQMIRAALDKGAITGTGANARLAVQKALETSGIVGPGKAADTQALMAGLGKLTLSGIKTSGLGGGNGFTDKDRTFLQSAISGEIDSTPENLRRVADLSERVATATHAKGQKVLQRWGSNPSLGAVAQDSVIDPLPSGVASNTGPAQTFDALPNPSEFNGKRMRAPDGTIIRSNGKSWIKE